LRPKWNDEVDVDEDGYLGIDEAETTLSEIPSDLRQQLLRQEQELCAQMVGLKLPGNGVVLLCQVERNVRKLGGSALEPSHLIRCCSYVKLRDLDQGYRQGDDEGIGLAIRSAVVVAEH
jgi:hypothetical protein